MLELRKGTELKGRYVIHEVIGTGGAASVWKASDKQLTRDVAIKRLLKAGVLSEDGQLQMLLDEARKSAVLIHTNIVQVYDVIEEAGEHLLIMEYVNGESLHKLLREKATNKETLPLDASIPLLRELLSGLSHAHSCNVCHRDLSPMNILLTAQRIPKIADFGIARVITPITPNTREKVHSSQGGTGNPHFMSPEQARGELADFSSDLFMIGIIGYLLLAGRHPYAHPSGLFTIPELLQDLNFTPEAPRAPSTLTTSEQRLFKEYGAVVMRLLHRERAARFATAREAIDAIDAVTPSSDCPSCGERVPEHHKYCGLCGARLETTSTVQALISSSTSSTSTTTTTVAEQSWNSTPRTADRLCEEGFQFSRRRDWDRAILQFREALKADPHHFLTHWNLGFALNRLGRYSEAEEVLTAGLSFDLPDHRSSLFYERSLARSNQKKYDQSLADVNESLTLQPRSTKALYARARIHLYRGDIERARQDASLALEWVPDHAGALRLLRDLD